MDEQLIMDVAEVLMTVDPIRTYPRRAAESVALIVRAKAFVLEREGAAEVCSEPPPDAGQAPALSLPLRVGRRLVGTLHLYGARHSTEPDLHRVRWGARCLALGLERVDRFGRFGARRNDDALRAALDRAPLTPRERDVVTLLVSGQSTREIAETAGITTSTVNTYLKRIFAKVGVHSRVELVARFAGTAGPDVETFA